VLVFEELSNSIFQSNPNDFKNHSILGSSNTHFHINGLLLVVSIFQSLYLNSIFHADSIICCFVLKTSSTNLAFLESLNSENHFFAPSSFQGITFQSIPIIQSSSSLLKSFSNE
jgi:hypothetical protein